MIETNETTSSPKKQNQTTTTMKILFIMSLLANVVFIGKSILYDKLAYPSDKDTKILAEMLTKVVHSNAYRKIDDDEKIMAITPYAGKLEGIKFPYNYGVRIDTTTQAYFFDCAESTCSDVETYGTSYSDYQDKKPVLPFKNK